MLSRLLPAFLLPPSLALAQHPLPPDPLEVARATRAFEAANGESPRQALRRIGVGWLDSDAPVGALHLAISELPILACAHLFDEDHDVAIGAAAVCSTNGDLLLQEEARRVTRVLGAHSIQHAVAAGAGELVDCVDAVTAAELLDALPAAEWAARFVTHLHRSMRSEHVPALLRLCERLQASDFEAAAGEVMTTAFAISRFSELWRAELGTGHCRLLGLPVRTSSEGGLHPVLAAVLSGIAAGRPSEPGAALVEWCWCWLADSVAGAADADLARRLAEHHSSVWRLAALRIAIDASADDVITGLLEDQEIRDEPLGRLGALRVDVERRFDHDSGAEWFALLEHDPHAFVAHWRRHRVPRDGFVMAPASLLRPRAEVEPLIATAMLESMSLAKLAATLAVLPGTRTSAVLDHFLDLTREQSPRPFDFPEHDDALLAAGEPTAIDWTWALAAAELHAPDRTRESLRNWSASPDPRVRAFARRLLLRLGDPQSAALLREVAADVTPALVPFEGDLGPWSAWLELSRSSTPALVTWWREQLAAAGDPNRPPESLWSGLGLVAAETSPRLVAHLLPQADWGENVRAALAEARVKDALWSAALTFGREPRHPTGIGELDDPRVVPWLRRQIGARHHTFDALVDLAVAGDPVGRRRLRDALSSLWYRFVTDASQLRQVVLAAPDLRPLALDLITTNCCASAIAGDLYRNVLIPRLELDGYGAQRTLRTLRPYLERLRYSHVLQGWTANALE